MCRFPRVTTRVRACRIRRFRHNRRTTPYEHGPVYPPAVRYRVGIRTVLYEGEVIVEAEGMMQAERAAREQGLEPEGGLSLSEREYIALEPVSEQDLES